MFPRFFPLFALLFLSAPVCLAQPIARVEKIKSRVEISAAEGVWRAAPLGATLEVGQRLRTGRRAGADVRFFDRSLLRLGQLSSLELRGPREMRLTAGQILFSALSPARILAGAAVAEIKGTVPLVTLFPDGSAEFTLYSGALEVISAQNRVALQPGEWVRALPDGSFSEVKIAPPLAFATGRSRPPILEEARNGPFAGGPDDLRLRSDPANILLEGAAFAVAREGAGGAFLPFLGRNSLPDNSPTPPIGAAVIGLASTRSGAAAGEMTGETHLDEATRALGRIEGVDFRLLRLQGDGGTRVNAGRFAYFAANGRTFYDFAVTPFRMQSGARRVESTTISQASVLYRGARADVVGGRQRFLSGPVQASLWGSMVRQNGRISMDAVRLMSSSTTRTNWEAAYLLDAFPRRLPFDVAGAQRGFYGRFERRGASGSLGLNLLKYSRAPVSHTTGATLDWALPLAQNRVEFYGEAGRDPFRRRLTTLGLIFPRWADKSGFDVFLEVARPRASAAAGAPRQETAARVYRRLSSGVHLLASAHHFQGQGTTLSLGVTVGARALLRSDD